MISLSFLFAKEKGGRTLCVSSDSVVRKGMRLGVGVYSCSDSPLARRGGKVEVSGKYILFEACTLYSCEI